MTEREHLAQAEQHISKCKAHIARQHLRIDQAIVRGHDTEAAEDLLDALQVRLRAFEPHRELILDRLKSGDRNGQ
jgi:hypothetical protein